MKISYLLEHAESNDEWSGGLSYGFAKCYDHILPSMAIDVLLYRGAPVSVVQGLRDFTKLTAITSNLALLLVKLKNLPMGSFRVIRSATFF